MEKKKKTKALMRRIAFRFDPITYRTFCDTCNAIVYIEDEFKPFRKNDNSIGIDCKNCY